MKRCALRLVLLGLVMSVPGVISAQDTIPFVPSPMHVVQRMLEVAEITKSDILYDMGSGDGRVVIEAAKKYGIRAVGVDLNPDLVAKARENAVQEGVSHLVEFRAAQEKAELGLGEKEGGAGGSWAGEAGPPGKRGG